MSHNGLVNGFYFDPEVFTEYMQEQSLLNNVLIDSGVVVQSDMLADSIGEKSNIGTAPIFHSVDSEPDALNYDGETDNEPTEITGGKQTFMAAARMKAWKEVEFTRYLTGESPLQNLANKLVVPYWKNQWEKTLYSILNGIMGVSEMSTHKTDLSVTTGSITDANMISTTSALDLGQKALGDKRETFKVMICNSAVATRLKKLSLTTNITYFSDVLKQQVTVPAYNGMILMESDTGTADLSVSGYPVYHSYLLGQGAILGAEKEVPTPYAVDYDYKTKGGQWFLYTKQAHIYHPNGFSVLTANIAKESPTNAELATSANWKLELDNHKLIPVAELITNG